MPADKMPKYPVLTLSKGLDILDTLSKDTTNRGYGISELSKILGIGKSTVHRLLDTLVAYKYVDRIEDNSRYRLAWGLYAIGQCVTRQNQLFSIDNSLLIDLNKQCGATVNLAILANHEVVLISKVDASVDSTNVYINNGDRETLYATALGKVLVSELDPIVLLDVVPEPMEQLTPHTVSSMAAFNRQLAQVRECGYAVDDEEYCMGLYCVAMPIRDYTGSIVAAISVSTPKRRTNEKRNQQTLEHLKRVSEQYSILLGYRFA